MEKGWDLFVPETEDNHIDIIAMKDDITRRIQVKSSWETPNGSAVKFKLQKHMGNSQLDYYAFWIPQIDSVVYFKFDNQKTISVAYEKSTYDNYRGRNWWKNFRTIN